MCGVCGIVVLDEAEIPGVDERVARMVRALEHRGPDDSGLLGGPAGAILGATRLKIRGLVGHQPMADQETGVVVVCNGEIDNHRELRAWLEERGHVIEADSDVAVLPALYIECGAAFVERLVGAFAIAVWDPRSGELLLARDRAGERPLFYAVRAKEVIFATEIAAIAQDDDLQLTPDREALDGYLRFGCFTAPESPFEEVRKVGPGETVTFDGEEVRRERYWRWAVTTTAKHAGSLDAFDRVFRRAVERQTDVDVEYGAFLSGGVDSSLVVAVLRSVRPDYPVRAYTLRFDEPSYDEGGFARQVAEQIGVESTEVWVRPEDIPESVALLVSTAGEPLGDPAWVPTSLLARRASQDVRVALVGEGGDEVFGGYPTYVGAILAQYYGRLPRPLRSLLRSVVRLLPTSDRKVTYGFLLKRFVAAAELDGWSRHRFWTSNVPPPLLERLGRSSTETDPEPGDLLDLILRNDLETTLAEGLLTKADRASMTWALELRTPFLDRDVLEFAAALPDSQRVRRLTTKSFLKEYALRYLPREIVYRTKRGLSVPLSSWLRGPLLDWARTRIESGRLQEVGIRPEVARELFEEHLSQRADNARALWTLIVLVEWLDWVDGRREAAL